MARPGRKSAARTERRRAAVDRRRERYRRAARLEQQRRRRRRIGLGALAIVAVAAIGAAVVVVVDRQSGSSGHYSLTSTVVADPGGPITISNAPAAYSLTYQIDTYGDEGQSTSTENISVQRPFNGFVVSKEGPPPG